MLKKLQSAPHETLVWLPEVGIGYYPVPDSAAPYDDAYFERYQRQDKTEVGDRLNRARVELVQKYTKGDELICDVGIGGGRFVSDLKAAELCMRVRGTDVNQRAIDWLTERGIWHVPTDQPVDCLTFWDSLEHIHDPAPILASARRHVFVSIPIFRDCEHILRSKHFRKDEHCLYFTRDGFRTFMAEHGFELVESNTMEQDAGREDIGTFVFKRVNDGAR